MPTALLGLAADTAAWGCRLVAGAAVHVGRRLAGPRPAPPPPPADTRDGRWGQDVTYLARELPRLHVRPWEHTSRESFLELAGDLLRDVPRLADHEIRVRLARLVASLGDPHTAVALPREAGVAFPFRVDWFSDGLFVTRSAPEHADLLGHELLRVGGLSAAEACRRISTVVAHRNDARVRQACPPLLSDADLLHALDVLPERGRGHFAFRTPGGKTRRLALGPAGPGSAPPAAWPALPAEAPLYRRRPEDPFWSEYLEPQRALYLRYRRCVNPPGFWRWSAGIRRVLRRRRVDRLLIDLRGNGGGDSTQFRSLLLGQLRAYRMRGRGESYGLIDRGTFSSAALNAVQTREEAGIPLAGQTAGGHPNGPGEVRTFRLPNSRLRVWYATRIVNLYPEVDDDGVSPDLPVEVSSAEALAGRDPVLEAVLAG